MISANRKGESDSKVKPMTSQSAHSPRGEGPLYERVAGEPPSPWRRLWIIVKVVELRLRFVAIMAGTGLVFGYWDTLVNLVEKWNRNTEARHEASVSIEYFCPMHPSVISEQAVNCSICGMALSQRERSGIQILPAGVLSRLQLSPGRIAQAGIRTFEVGYAPVIETLNTVGLIGYNERRYVLVASDARGRARIDRLLIASEGEHVEAGERLAELYGYDVSQSIRVFQEAHRSTQGVPDTQPDPLRTPLGDPSERVRLATQGLKVLGIRQDEIDSLTRQDDPNDCLPVLAPISGHVVKKYVHEGQYVPEGTVLFEIADLGHVWVSAQFFEDQLARIHVGQSIAASVAAFPGEVFEGKVELIAPALDPATRTASARFELNNPAYRLRPGMFASVTLNLASPVPSSQQGANVRSAAQGAADQAMCPVSQRPLGSMARSVQVAVGGRTVWVCCDGCRPKLEAEPAKYLARLEESASGVLSLPESAVVDTGAETIVYVEAEAGVFEGRAVVLGARCGDRYPVLSGLARGERVAAAGAFLIDAETRLNSASRAGGRGVADPRTVVSQPENRTSKPEAQPRDAFRYRTEPSQASSRRLGN
jgi:membrane fusion protein, copper/silver efflux system